jgi:hypothetical protein
MDLHQIQAIYQENDDRILVRATFTRTDANPLEYRAWFTRRFVKILWPGILASFEAQAKLNQPQAAHMSDEIVNMENQAAMNEIKTQGNFETPYASSTYEYPLGQIPILICNVSFTIDANQPIQIDLSDAQSHNLALILTPVIFHGFCTLLQRAVKTAEWEVDLQLPGTSLPDDSSRVLN